MDVNLINELLSDLESDRVERTTSTNNTDKFGEAICAFSNDFPRNKVPGYLIIGVEDDGYIVGASVTDQLLQNLAAVRSDGNIQPIPAITVQKISLSSKDVAVVEVQPSDLPPVRYKGRVWIRVGPRRALATIHEENLLSERRTAGAQTFDARPCLEASLTDLSIRLFEAYRGSAVANEVIQENQRSLEQQLASLRFFDPERRVPTTAAILLFGTNPRFFLPGAYIQYLQLPSNEITDVPIDQAEISGDLRSVLEELLLRTRIINTHELRARTVLQEDSFARYPDIALREILLNAIVHRTYESNTPVRFSVFSDRVEIASPGGLYGEVDIQNMASSSSYRNPVLAEALKVLGYVNRFGYGIQRAKNALAKNGSRPLEIVATNSTVLVVLWARDSA